MLDGLTNGGVEEEEEEHENVVRLRLSLPPAMGLKPLGKHALLFTQCSTLICHFSTMAVVVSIFLRSQRRSGIFWGHGEGNETTKEKHEEVRFDTSRFNLNRGSCTTAPTLNSTAKA